MKQIEEFIAMLEASLREQAESLEQAAEELLRFSISVRELYRSYCYPPYRERMNPKKYRTRIYWHRIRSNPQRRRKPH